MYTETEKIQKNKLIEEKKYIDKKIEEFEISNGIVELNEKPVLSHEEAVYEEELLEKNQADAEYYSDLLKKREDLNKQLFEIEHTAFSRDKISEWNREKNSFLKGNFINEGISEEELDDDIFSRKNKAVSIAESLCDSRISSPYNIAILGDWGTGKTSFFKYIKQSIKIKNDKLKKKDKDKDTYKIVDFNAAEYSSKVISKMDCVHIEQQWGNILKTLLEAYENEFPFRGAICFNWNCFWQKKPFGRLVLFIICCLILLVPFFFISFWGKVNNGNLQLFGSVSGILGITLVSIPIFKSALNLMLPISERVENSTKLPNYIDILGTRERIVFDVKVLIKSWLKNKDERIIVFVDDCDRCSTEGIMELFEAMHLFLDLDKVFFVFAIDPRLLTSAVSKYYNTSGSDALVDQFLQKYVARTYSLNSFDYVNLIKSYKNIIEPNFDKHCLYPDDYYFIYELIENESNTPRNVKHILNTIVLMKNYYMSDEKLGEKIGFRDVISWYIMNYYYTNICDKLRTYFIKENDFHKIRDIIGWIDITDRSFFRSKVFNSIAELRISELIKIEFHMGMMIKNYRFNNENLDETSIKNSTSST